MSPLVEFILALILFLPWFCILTALYWLFPRTPRSFARVAFDLAAIASSFAAFLASVYWALAYADASYGKLWPQILATAIGYGVFLAAMTCAYVLRRQWLRRSAHNG